MHHSVLHSHIALHRFFFKRFFFYQYFNSRKVAFIKEEKCARKIANACFFEKKTLEEGVFAKLCDDLRRIFIKRIKMSSK